MAPINALPDEVLIQIFTHATEYQWQGPTFRVAHYSDLSVDTDSLITLTHVCHRWRNVAVNYAPFWTRTDCHVTKRLKTFAERAGTLPLSLYLDNWRTTMFLDSHDVMRHTSVPVVLGALAKSVGRLDAMLWESDGSAVRNPYAPDWLSNLDMPAIRCLNLYVGVHDPGEDVIPDGGSSLNIVLFNQTSSPLRALALIGVPWVPINDFPHLTHLYLSFEPMGFVNLAPILALLSRSPNLESLHLASIWDATDSDDNDAPPAILNRLRSVVMSRCDNFLLTDLFRRLSLPNTIAVRAIRTYIYGEDALTIPGSIAEHSNDLDIRLSENEYISTQIVLQGPSSGFLLRGNFGIGIDYASAAAWLGARLRECFDTSIFYQLSSFTMDAVGVETQPLLSFLRRMPALQSLSLRLTPRTSLKDPPCDAEHALAALAAFCDALDPETAHATDGSQHTFPALRRLRLGCDMPPAADGTDLADFAATLERTLRARARIGLPALELLTVQPVVAAAVPTVVDHDELADAFGGLEALVGTLTIVGPGEKPFGDFEVQEVWLNRGEDLYWEIEEEDRPQYTAFL